MTISCIISTIICTIPLFLLSLGSVLVITPEILILCSICVGVGFGGLGSMFPLITRKICGSRNYGLACGMILGPVPIGIFLSNIIFAKLYDSALYAQNQRLATSSTKCYGSVCFVTAFQVMLAIGFVPLMLSFGLYKIRMKIDKEISLILEQ
jgi:MFS family permease